MRLALFGLFLLVAWVPTEASAQRADGEVIVVREGEPAAVWVKRALRNPFFGEPAGYAMLDEGRPAEARKWFGWAYAYADSVRSAEGLRGDAALAGFLIKLAWLLEGPDAAAAEIARVPDALMEAQEVLYPTCFLRHGELEWLVDVLWRGLAVQDVGPAREIVRTGPDSYGEKPSALDSCFSAI